MMEDDTFVLPDLGEGLKEAEIVAWHVAEGDHVVADQPLVSVETDKAVVEIPAPHTGRIARLLADVHTVIAVGAPLIRFGEDAGADTGTVVGSLTPAAPVPAVAASGARRIHASPAIRTLAASLRVSLDAVVGTGPDGAIQRADVERASAAQKPGGAIPLTGVRRAMALRMAEAGASVVPATLTDDADVTAWTAATPITARLAMAIAAACAAEPALNAAFDGRAMTRRMNTTIDLGMAVDTADGLFVPVLRDIGAVDAETISRRLEVLLKAVEARTIAPDAMRGATITLSNFGTLGGRFATLVVVPPQTAILGAGRIRSVAAPSGQDFAVRRMLPLSLTFDHRAVTGGEAARFMTAVIAHLSRPS